MCRRVRVTYLHMQHGKHAMLLELDVQGAQQAFDVEVAVARQMRAHLCQRNTAYLNANCYY